MALNFERTDTEEEVYHLNTKNFHHYHNSASKNQAKWDLRPWEGGIPTCSIPGRRSVCLSSLPLCYVFVSVCFCAQIRAASSPPPPPQSDADVMSPFLSSVAVAGRSVRAHLALGQFRLPRARERRRGPGAYMGEGKTQGKENAEDISYEKYHTKENNYSKRSFC